MVLGQEVRIKEFLSLCLLVELEDILLPPEKKNLRASQNNIQCIATRSRLLEKKKEKGKRAKLIEDPDRNDICMDIRIHC